jgi:hypothetical protein
MTNGNGVSRGDRNRNARLARLRELVPLENAIVGSIWPTGSRWWWSPTTTRVCWRVRGGCTATSPSDHGRQTMATP